MADQPTPFPTAEASDRLISDGIRTRAAQPSFARVGDLVGYCVNSEADTWSLAPAAAVDSRGVVMGVTMRSGEVRSLWTVASLDAYFVAGAEGFDLAALQSQRWRKFRGLVALRAACKPAWRKP